MNYMDIAEISPERKEKLINDLNKLVELEMEIQTTATMYSTLTRDEKAGLRDWIKKWFSKVLEIAGEFKPREFAVSAEIGFPPRIGASFTWSHQRSSKRNQI